MATASSQPLDITAGPDGNVWFTETGSQIIGRISPTGIVKEFPVPTTIGQPVGITGGPGGNLWFTGGSKIASISSTGNITEFPTGIVVGFIAAGPDGNFWVTSSVPEGPESNKIGRISPSGSITVFSAQTANCETFTITSGPDGNAWFTELKGNKIGRVSSDGSITEFPIPTTDR
jgi:virginiamycin B lyase